MTAPRITPEELRFHAGLMRADWHDKSMKEEIRWLDDAAAELERLTQENERLRGALMRVRDFRAWDERNEVESLRDIAVRALSDAGAEEKP